MMREYLTQGAIDGFLGLDMEVDDNSNTGANGEGVGVYPIPRELLVNMPIADVGPNTKIIHVGPPTQNKNGQETNVEPEIIQGPANDPPAPFATPQPGTSGVDPVHHAQVEMEVEENIAPINLAPTPVTTQKKDGTGMRLKENNQQQPKKGFLTKNRKTKVQNDVETQEEDGTLKERMTLLAEIKDLMKNSYGLRRNEVSVWATYIGLKAERLPAGKSRDKLLVRIEQMINDELYENDNFEE